MIIPPGRWRMAAVLGAIAAVAGGLVALHYHSLGLTLSHYDARGHLVVSRRIFDSITPGWQQIGAVWLPLPHLLNAIPIQLDVFYRTGASAVAISVLAFAVATGSIAWIVAGLTGSLWAAAAGALVFALNPNVLYLQSTPMTEPLLVALTLSGVAVLMQWTREQTIATEESDRRRWITIACGSVLALACLTRYEAWPVAFAGLGASAWTLWRSGMRPAAVARRILTVAAYPAGSILGFFVFSRIVVGSWFPSDFFVAENTAQGHPYEAIAQIAWGVQALSGRGVLAAGAAGAVALAAIGFGRRHHSAALIPLALIAAAAVPWSAFFDGHPYRIRYMIPLVAAEAVCAGAAAGLWKRGRALTVVALVAIAVLELHPLDASAPMIGEARWDVPNAAPRDDVSRCLAAGYRDESVMVSMGSLGHYMQDLSRFRFRLRDFLHEGNGDIWLNALEDPRPFAGWMLIEEKAEGGDLLAKRARENPTFLDGFSRVCEGAGIALYRRDAAPRHDDVSRR